MKETLRHFRKLFPVVFAVIFMISAAMAQEKSYGASASGEMGVAYSMHFAQLGTKEVEDNTALSSTTFPNAFSARLYNQPKGVSGTIQYQVNLSRSGWLPVAENGQTTGNRSSSQALESVKVWLNGDLAKRYDVYTSVQVDGKWSKWYTNGTKAGKEGVGKHITGVWIAIAKKGTPAPKDAGKAFTLGEASVPSGKVRKLDTSKPMIALTFDDGPSTGNTDKVLDALVASGGKATFFVVGQSISGERVKPLVRAASLGMEIGNHSWAHENLVKLSQAQVRESLTKTNAKIKEITGLDTVLVRPPYGSFNASTKEVLKSMGSPAILWSIDTLDWKTKNTQKTVDTVLSNVKDGDIILIHDTHAPSAAAAQILIPELTKRGYQLVTVSELAAYRGGMEAGKTYGSFRKK